MDKPFEIEVNYAVRINNLEVFVKDVKAAVMQIQSLPFDITMRNTTARLLEDVLNNAVKANKSNNVAPAAETPVNNEDATKSVKEKLADGEPVQVNELEN